MDKADFNLVFNPQTNAEERHIVSKYGNEYVIGKKMGMGGVAKVFHAYKVGDPKPLVFKEYKKSDNPKLNQIHSGIKKNIITLIQKPLKDNGGALIPHFVRPLDIIDLPVSGGFGYIMEEVDTKTYLPVLKLLRHNDLYPDAKNICKFCKGFAEFFKTVHLKGWCYKDINEGNIYINPQTGDFFIIDCDNISVPNNKTILGTPGYMAPEVYQTETPDTQSDYFSIASYFFRLLVGSYPLDGPWVEQYMIANEQDVGSAAPKIYGSDALFAFHPTDKRNAVYMSKAPDHVIQTRKWKALPKSIRRCFLKTFVDALPYDKRTMRTNDVQWIKCFEELEANHLVACKKCKKYNFDNRKTCFCCGDSLPAVVKKPTPPKKKPIPSSVKKPNVPSQRVNPPSPPTSAQKRYEIVFDSLSMINGNRVSKRIAIPLDVPVSGRSLHPDFPDRPFLKACHKMPENIYVVYNFSGLTWELAREGKTAAHPSGSGVQVKSNLVIKIDKTKYLLKVLGVREKR